jgi:hypothetical protein
MGWDGMGCSLWRRRNHRTYLGGCLQDDGHVPAGMGMGMGLAFLRQDSQSSQYSCGSAHSLSHTQLGALSTGDLREVRAAWYNQ